jgi:hypothetical protein
VHWASLLLTLRGAAAKALVEYELATKVAPWLAAAWFDLGILLVDAPGAEDAQLAAAMTCFDKYQALGGANPIANVYRAEAAAGVKLNVGDFPQPRRDPSLEEQVYWP